MPNSIAQCGLRPGQARELALNESGLNADDPSGPRGFCDHCQTLVADSAYRQRRREAGQLFGPAGNARVILLSVRVNIEAIARGETLCT
jgi:hypothetical protein